MIRFLAALFATMLVVLFGFANMHIVPLSTVVGEDVRASLVFLLLAAFAVGFIVATLIAMHRSVSRRRGYGGTQEEGRDQNAWGIARPAPAPLKLPAPPRIPLPVEHASKGCIRRLWR